MLMNQSVKVVKRKRPSTTDYSDSIVVTESKQSRRAQFTVSDELAGDKFHYINYEVQKLKECFPENSKLWTVDKCYPYSEKGPLFIDEPVHPEEIDLCQLKAAAMKQSKKRYIAITPNMDLKEAFVELDRCLI